MIELCPSILLLSTCSLTLIRQPSSPCLYSRDLQCIIPDMASWHWAQNFTLGIDSDDTKPRGSYFLSSTAMVLKEGQLITYPHSGQCLGAFLIATTWGRALLVLLGREARDAVEHLAIL